MAEPMHVYPDPDGTTRSGAYAPSNTALAAGSIASGAAAVVTAAAGSGTAPDQIFLFLQEAGRNGAAGGFLGLHAANGTYVSLFLLFSALSVVLATINLVIGLRMKERLLKLSARANEICKTNGVFTWWVGEKKKS